jgi:hypothetical protein
MKRVLLFSILILSVFFSIIAYGVSAEYSEDESKINKAYTCLRDKIDTSCSSSLEDNIFVLLAIEKCKDEVIEKSRDRTCWPSSACDVKTTAQAVLALENIGEDTTKAEEWLLSQIKTPTDLKWYLEIESNEATKCNIEYAGKTYPIIISGDRKINTNAGSCLSLSEGGWWLEISKNCYDNEFKISCDKGFLTTLLFKEESSSTIHVMEETHSSSANGATVEKINSLCFTKSGSCYYEGSLWATLILGYLGYDISPYIPYLTVMKDKNDKYIPESFLYLITGSFDFRNELLSKQINNKYWEKSGDRFYDTALALFPLYHEEVQEKDNAKDWLLSVQGNDGCWNNGNIKDTAFLLYSVWPSYFIPDIEDEYECETDDQCESGYECIGGMCVEIGGELSCDINHLELCNETECEDIGKYWYNEVCNEYECEIDDQCESGYECINGTCIAIEEIIEEGEPYWKNSYGYDIDGDGELEEIETLFLNLGSTTINAFLSNSNISTDESVYISIYENKKFAFDNGIRTLTGTVNSEGNINLPWEIDQSDINKIDDFNNPIYFLVNDDSSLRSKNNINIEILNCVGIYDCEDYLFEGLCTIDPCDIGSCYWYNGFCNAEEESSCSIDNLDLCNKTNCADVGGYWYNEVCNEYECETDNQCDPGYECIGGTCFEIGGELSCDINHLELCDETNCEDVGGYWYDESCNEYECETDGQCNFGYECSHGTCVLIGEDKKDCEDEGYYCMSEIFCGGRILGNYECDVGIDICCSIPKSNTCFEQGGEICLSSETCTGNSVGAEDLDYGEICCVNGYCKDSTEEEIIKSQCEEFGGTCRYYGCEEDEEESVYECEGDDTCCMEEKEKEGGSYLWIYILGILIILAILAIIFRNKLKPYYLRIMSKFGKGKRKGPPGIFPSNPNIRRPIPRRILPPRRPLRHPPTRHTPTRHTPIRPSSSKNKNEVDDVLKKLKEMGE